MNDQKGLTFIEVMLTLAILSIIGVLALSILQQSFSSKNKLSNRINVSNESNVMLAMIEKEYYAKDFICIHWDKIEKQLFMIKDNDSVTKLHDKSVKVINFEIEPQPNSDRCIHTKQKLTIRFSMSAAGEKGSPFITETTLIRR